MSRPVTVGKPATLVGSAIFPRFSQLSNRKSSFLLLKGNSSFEISPNCGCSLLQKTHDFTLDGNLPRFTKKRLTEILDQFHGKGILIIRDPFKAIQSYRNYMFGGMKGTAPVRAFKGAGRNL